MSELTELMGSRKFYLSETGGGCTAFTHQLQNGSVLLITRAEDAEAPGDVSDACTVGQVDADGNWKLVGHADDVLIALSLVARSNPS